MCGNNRRAARRGGAYGAGHHSAQPFAGAGGVMALINGLQQMSVASRQPQQRQYPASTPPRATESIQPQTQGIVYLSTYNEKTYQPAQESLNFEVLPTYEESTTITTPQIARATVVQPAPLLATEAPYVPTSTILSQNPGQTRVSPGMKAFNTALASYRSGQFGGRKQAKRAARNLVNELLIQERARREAAYGPLMCGQRKQIKRDLKPVRSMLKGVIREAKRERAF